MGLVDTSSHSSTSDSRQGAADNARVFRGAGAKYIESGSLDLSHSKLSSGNLSLKDVRGDVILGDNGAGIAAVSSIFAGLIDTLVNSHAPIDGSGPPPNGDVLGLGSSASPDATTSADNVSITDAAWWTTQRKVIGAVLVGLLLLLIFKK